MSRLPDSFQRVWCGDNKRFSPQGVKTPPRSGKPQPPPRERAPDGCKVQRGSLSASCQESCSEARLKKTLAARREGRATRAPVGGEMSPAEVRLDPGCVIRQTASISDGPVGSFSVISGVKRGGQHPPVSYWNGQDPL